MKLTRDQLLQHLPNAVTFSRIVMAAVFPFSHLSWHLPIVLLALLSEFLDGALARRLGSTTYLGQVLDPIADKLFFLSVSLTWLWIDKLTLLQLLLLATRDLGVVVLVAVLALLSRLRRIRSIKAIMVSKVSTGLQYVAFLVILFRLEVPLDPIAFLAALTGLLATGQYAWLLYQRFNGAAG